MVKQSDLVPKSIEEYGSHANSDDEYEEYSEEEMLSEEELNEVVSSYEESTKKSSGGEEPDDKDSCTEESNEEDSDEEPEEPLEEEIEEDASVEEIIEEEIREESEEELNGKATLRSSADQVSLANGNDQVPSLLEVKKASDAVADDEDFSEYSDEELEEALEEDIEEDASVEEIIEEEISEELEEEPNENEALRSSADQPPLINDGDDISSLLEAKKTADEVVDVPRVSTKRRRSGWDIKAEDVVLPNDGGDQCKSRKTRWSSGTKVETSMLEDDNTELNKTRKTRWSSAQKNPDLQLFHKKLEKFLKLKTLPPPTIDGDLLSKLLGQEDRKSVV